jgi:uncharacterized protein (DUF433 family)
MPPRGFYLANEVGRLAGVSGYEIGQWARYGYIRASQSKRGQWPLVYSYQDIAEAMVVHQLRDRDVSYENIQSALAALRTDEDVGDWPLTHADLATVGGGEVVIRREGEHFDVTGRPWHEVIDVGDLQKIAADLRRGGWAARDVPDLQHIEVDPDRLSGRPTIRGRRLGAKDVAELALAGGEAVLTDEYELEPAEIRDAQRWWEAASSYEAAA